MKVIKNCVDMPPPEDGPEAGAKCYTNYSPLFLQVPIPITVSEIQYYCTISKQDSKLQEVLPATLV